MSATAYTYSASSSNVAPVHTVAPGLDEVILLNNAALFELNLGATAPIIGGNGNTLGSLSLTLSDGADVLSRPSDLPAIAYDDGDMEMTVRAGGSSIMSDGAVLSYENGALSVYSKGVLEGREVGFDITDAHAASVALIEGISVHGTGADINALHFKATRPGLALITVVNQGDIASYGAGTTRSILLDDAGVAANAQNARIVNTADGLMRNAVELGFGNDVLVNSGTLLGAVTMGGGNDFIRLDTGGDVQGRIDLGAGNDRLFVEEGAGLDDWLVLDAGDGHDFIQVRGSYNYNSILAGDGDDRVYGGLGWETIEGGDGRDILTNTGGRGLMNGGAGDDTLRGASAPETLAGGDQDDVIIGGGGVDTMYGDQGDDYILGTTTPEYLHGGTGDDTLVGHAGADELNGNDGDDRLLGGIGNDTLIGGRGADVMVGDDGADTFVFNDISESGVTDATMDRIYGFDAARDQLDFRELMSGALGYMRTDPFDGHPALRVAVHTDTRSDIEVDLDGDMIADMRIWLSTDAPLTAINFLF